MEPDYELLLINVSREKKEISDCFGDCIGQHLIAEYVKQYGYVSKVYSGCVIDAKIIVEYEEKEHRIPIIGFYCAADNIDVTLHFIQWIKKKYAEIITVVGGPQAVGLNDKTLFSNLIDYAIVGEGEIPVLKLLDFIIDNVGDKKNIPSLKYLENDVLYVNDAKNAAIKDLNSVPYPKYENALNANFRKGKTIGIITGRGCPFSCSFCFEGACSKNVRYRSIENVMEEIDYIMVNNPNLKAINVYDDTFTLNKERLFHFCNEMKKRGLLWYCEGHVAYISKNLDILPIMKESGLVGIQLGIESGSSEVLKKYNKRITPDEILEVVRNLKATGINTVSGNLIIGGAIESKITLQETKDFGKKLIQEGRGIIELSTVYFAPYPQTDMVLNPSKYGINIVGNAQDSCVETMRTVVVETSELQLNDIRKIKKEIDREFEKEYYIQAKKITKRELLQGLYRGNKQVDTNKLWRNVYCQIEHLSQFIKHLDVREQEYSDDKYLIRSFNDYVFENEQLITSDFSILGLEAKILYLANGKRTGKEIADILGIDRLILKNEYQKLNEKCLIYVSEF